MEIVKVIIKGELPYNCVACRFVSRNDYYCELLWKDVEYQYIDTRPPWCPLVSKSQIKSVEITTVLVSTFNGWDLVSDILTTAMEKPESEE